MPEVKGYDGKPFIFDIGTPVFCKGFLTGTHYIGKIKRAYIAYRKVIHKEVIGGGWIFRPRATGRYYINHIYDIKIIIEHSRENSILSPTRRLELYDIPKYYKTGERKENNEVKL